MIKLYTLSVIISNFIHGGATFKIVEIIFGGSKIVKISYFEGFQISLWLPIRRRSFR